MAYVTSFDTGMTNCVSRFEVAQDMFSELARVERLDAHEVDSLYSVTVLSFDAMLSPEANMYLHLQGRPLDQRADIAFAEACWVVDAFRELEAMNG